ncbi:MAG: alcohol dehydrogenase catalytic domain-containing protein [Sphingomonadales bacterium]|nr:alcohol dehydrogenase catalytic domain-containing protein [Sphingomonadales bacterium]
MRVAMFHGAGQPLVIEPLASAPLGPHDLRVKVARCGICGSDVSMTSGSPFDYPAHIPLGHEYAGEVVEVGKLVTGFRIGDRVACMPKAGCGQCDACARGHTFFCPTGPMQFGGFGDEVVVLAAYAFLLPQTVSLAEGALVEPMACGRRGLAMAGLQTGQRVLVLGAGALGLSATYWARAMGAGRIVVAARSRRRDEAVLELGADAVHAFDADDPAELAAKLGGEPDIVVEAIGKPGMIARAVELVRWGGTVVSLGMCTAGETLMPIACAGKEARLLFPLAYSIGDFEETVRAFDADRVNPELMISDVIALEALPAVLEEMRGSHAYCKVQVDPRI